MFRPSVLAVFDSNAQICLLTDVSKKNRLNYRP